MNGEQVYNVAWSTFQCPTLSHWSVVAVVAQGQRHLWPINLIYGGRAFGHRSTTLPAPINCDLFSIIKPGHKVRSLRRKLLTQVCVSSKARCTQAQNKGVRDCFIMKLIPGHSLKWGWSHPWHPLLPTCINYFRICLVIQAEDPTQNEWDVSFMQLLVKALQGVKSRVDLNWSQQYRIRSSGD